MSHEKIPFKIWDLSRENRRLVLASATIDAVIEEAHKKDLHGEKLVLEEDGSVIDEDELLVHFKDRVLLLLNSNEIWSDNKKKQPSHVQLEAQKHSQLEPLREIHFENNDFELSSSPQSLILLNVPDCSSFSKDAPSCSSFARDSENSPPTTLSMSSTALSESNNEESIANIQMQVLCKDFKIPWGKFPSTVMDLCRNNEKLGCHLKTVVHIIVDEFRVKSKYITIDAFRDIAGKLCQSYPNTFAFKDTEGNLISPRNSPLVTSMMQRNNYLNRAPKSRSISSPVPLKMKKISKNFENTCINWQPPDSEEKSATIQIKKEKLIKLSKKKNFTEEEYNEIGNLMDYCFPEQRKFLNANLIHNVPIIDVKKEWPFLLHKDFLFKHFEKLTEKEIVTVMSNFKSNVEKIIRYGDKHKPRIMKTLRTKSNDENLIAADFVSNHFNEDNELIYKNYPLGTEVKDIGPPTHRPWFAVIDAGAVDYFYVFSNNEVVNAESNSWQEALIQTFCMYFILNEKYPHTASQTLDFIQRYYCNIHTETSRGEKKKYKCHF